MIEENDEKTSVRLVGTGIWTRDLPNASLVLYHGENQFWESLCVFSLSQEMGISVIGGHIFSLHSKVGLGDQWFYWYEILAII